MKKIWVANCCFNGHTFSATSGDGVVNLRSNNKVFKTISEKEWEGLFPVGSNEPSLYDIANLKRADEEYRRGY